MAVSSRIKNVKWNFKAVKSRSRDILFSQYREQIEDSAQKALNQLENLLIRKIREHIVTQEIEAGRQDPLDAPNLSGTLGGYGNLWSFIGFYEGDDPIGDMISNLEGKTRIISVRKTTGDGIVVNATTPTITDAYESSPMPWSAGRSWAEGISRGISGFGRYLNTDTTNSRSGGGVQGSNNVRRGGYSRVPYLTPIFIEKNRRLQEILSTTFKLRNVK